MPSISLGMVPLSRLLPSESHSSVRAFSTCFEMVPEMSLNERSINVRLVSDVKNDSGM